MKWKETVLKPSRNPGGTIRFPTLQEQAEVSFKAGYIEGCEKIAASHKDALDTQYRGGMKTVVEWIEKHNYPGTWGNYPAWEAQLKEWGLSEVRK